MPKYVPFPKYRKLERKLRKIIRRGSETDRRDALAMVVGLHGLRVSEIINLNVVDLDQVDETLAVQTLKGGKPRKLHLGPGVFRELRKLVGRRGKDRPLFETTNGNRVCETQWQRFCRSVTAEVLGGKGLRFHALRHTCGIRWYHDTKDVIRVMQRLGHRSINSTQVYVEDYGVLTEAEIRRIGRVPVLPCVVGDRRGSKRGRREAAGRRSSKEKTRVSLGRESEKREITHRKTQKRANGGQKPTSTHVENRSRDSPKSNRRRQLA
jgi:integrase